MKKTAIRFIKVLPVLTVLAILPSIKGISPLGAMICIFPAAALVYLISEGFAGRITGGGTDKP